MVSDGLFGNCQKSDSLLPDVYQYQLTGMQRQQMEDILQKLIESGYAWSHQYTQCVIANVLLAYRSGVDFDLGFCTSSQFPPASSEHWTADDQVVVPGWLSDGRSFDGFPPEIRPPVDRRSSLEEDYPDVPEADSQQVKEVEEFLQSLSSDDLDQLKKYVVDDLTDGQSSEGAAGPPGETEQTGVVRRFYEDDPHLKDDIGEWNFCGTPCCYLKTSF